MGNSRSYNILLGAIPFILVILLWWAASANSLVPYWLIPSPQQVVSALVGLSLDGTLPRLLGISALNVLPPFFLAFFAALVIGIIIGVYPVVARMTMPFLSAFYPIPSLAWLPLIILLSGFSRWSIWILIFLTSFLRMIYGVSSSVQGINKVWLLVAKNYKLSQLATITKIIIPGTLPYLVGTGRSGFGTAWRALIGAEMLVATLGGLGRFIWQAQWFFNFDNVLAGIIVIGLIGVVTEIIIFRKLEKHILYRWGMTT